MLVVLPAPALAAGHPLREATAALQSAVAAVAAVTGIPVDAPRGERILEDLAVAAASSSTTIASEKVFLLVSMRVA